jgi:hypothetical protein
MPRDQQFSQLVMTAEPRPFWLDRPDVPSAAQPLRGEAATDLVVIGGGFTGLWTALLAKESDPERSVVLVEGHRVAFALGIRATRWSLAPADRRSGRRNLWLRALDAAGLGFDSEGVFS